HTGRRSGQAALPASFKEELRRKEATEGEAVTLRCELTKASPVEWKKGPRELKPSDKYKMRQKDTTAELVIHQVDESDAGDYTCVCGDQQTTAAVAVHATLIVKGKDALSTVTAVSCPQLPRNNPCCVLTFPLSCTTMHLIHCNTGFFGNSIPRL
uniref:Ig-like domain-containing protein n=1 Tax=Crocodylus porosus TaxID=8502 RepID=A0A7M4E279_CROPO